MNEQELADLFSAQIDRILRGESAVDLAVDGDLPLLALGQQLSQVSFQASQAAQATFASQLASWFGPAGGLATTIFGLPKTLVLSLGAALAVMSAGLGLVVLISFIWTGASAPPAPDASPPAPAATLQPRPNTPVPAPPTATRNPATTTPISTRPPATSSLKDVLPTVTTSVGDTILLPTATPVQAAPTFTATLTGNQPNDDSSGGSEENSDTSGDTVPGGDQDRGHGNDLDGYDEDNPGQSDGVSGGNDQNNGSDGVSPGNLSGGGNGGSGGGSGGGNAGGGGNDGGQGGGKGNK